MSPNQTNARIARTEAYAAQVQMLFTQTVNRIIALQKKLPDLKDGEMFSFDAQTEKLRDEVEQCLRQLSAVATTAIANGIKLEWNLANAGCDKLLQSTFGKKIVESSNMTAWMKRNNDAMRAFTERSVGGLNLSQRVWKSTRQLRDEMEVAITVALGDGTPAASLSRTVRKYLNDPDLMFRRFRYKDPKTGKFKLKWKKRVIDPNTGKVTFIDYDKDSYRDQWTGPGYYKSAAQNAMRVARTETNIAYRRADHARWEQMDFVIGQRIQLSRKHPEKDICDKLQGDYPKDFVFDGWHPQCFCFATPINLDMKDIAEIMTHDNWREELKQLAEKKQIKDYPSNFKTWVKDNADKIAESRERGTEPYFIRNNARIIDNILNPDAKSKPAPQSTTKPDVDEQLESEITSMMQKAKDAGEEIQSTAEGIAHRHGAVVTPINFKSHDSILRKVMSERANPETPDFSPADLKDAVRNTIVAPRDSISGIIKDLQSTSMFMRWKEQKTELGYTGNIINVRTANGIIGEIQVNTPAMIYAKEIPAVAKSIIGENVWNKINRLTHVEGGLGHKYYEEWRVMSDDEKQSNRGKELLRKSLDYYSIFTNLKV